MSMILSLSPSDNASLMVVEICLTAVAVAVAFAWPRLGSSLLSRIESGFQRLARRRGLSVLFIGFSALLLRFALIPWFPIPLPFVPDDFSFLLASDTFAHGHLANPTPAMWTHFESIQIDMKPTYMSMYFPGPGLVFAAGQVLFGQPWFGMLIVSSLMCAAICWMLQAWLPPGWALLGGMLAVLRLGLFSYWINTYTGGAPIAALGGALVLGALPRLKRTTSHRYGLLMGLGIGILILTRPYEGMLLCLPVAAVLAHWALFGKHRPAPWVLIRRAALPLLVVFAAAAWMGYYDYRAFDSPFKLPYTVNRATYAIAPYFAWQHLKPEPIYRNEPLRHFYHEKELPSFKEFQTLPGAGEASLKKILSSILFFAGFALLLPLAMAWRVVLDKRMRFFTISILVYMAGLGIEIYLIPHYLAPFTATFYVLGLQGMRHLRVWKAEGRPVGLALVRFTVVLCLALGLLRTFAAPLNMRIPEWPVTRWDSLWYGPEQYGAERAQIETGLEQIPGKQLAIVRYSSNRNVLDQWVYNAADIDGSKVIWAHDLDPASNLELIRYYKDRKVWLVRTDTQPATVSPYPVPQQVTTGNQ
jgi:hypothetical protein